MSQSRAGRIGKLRLFYVYSHKDEGLRNELETHLTLLHRQGFISSWHDRKLVPGSDWEPAILRELELADAVLLLVSADFLASDFAYGREMKRALERHELGNARVVPIMLRECDWEHAPFAKLQALPMDAQPVTSWNNRDSAWTSVARGLRQIAEEMSVLVERQDEIPSRNFESGTTSVGGAAKSPMLEVLSLRHRVMEQNATWWRFSWLMEVRNRSTAEVKFSVSMDFLDEEGFVLDFGKEGGLRVAPLEIRTVRGFSLLGTHNATRVKTLSPRLEV